MKHKIFFALSIIFCISLCGRIAYTFAAAQYFALGTSDSGSTSSPSLKLSRAESRDSSDGLNSQEENRGVFSSKFCTIFYNNDVDLKKVNRKINLVFSDFYSPRTYKAKAGLSVEDTISDKFDAIFNKAEEILDMYPARIHVAINIYKKQEDMDRIYEEFFNEPNKAVSFYIYKTNTIYAVESKLNENILAHEMAHCIIDHYFVILPPRKIQEMLSSYVDLHLED